MIKFLQNLLLGLTFSLSAFAQGSVDFQLEIVPLLKAQPHLAEPLNGLSFERLGEGNRISYRMCPALAGRHVGSYLFLAHQKKSGRQIWVRFHTHTRFLRPDGKVLAEIIDDEWFGAESIADAVVLEESLERISFPDSPGFLPAFP